MLALYGKPQQGDELVITNYDLRLMGGLCRPTRRHTISRMCGRYAIYGPSREPGAYGVLADEWPSFEDNYNAAPSLDLPVIRRSPETGRRVCHLLRWGLVPHWASDPAIGTKMINARGETVASKPAFRAAYRKRRCLIPSAGFYEWQTLPGQKLKQPWFIRATAPAMAMGGLWESWTAPDGTVLRTFCVITVPANDLVAPIHDRMPLIVPPGDWDAWLDPETPPPEIDMMVIAYPADKMTAHKVSRAVSNARNNVSTLIDPLDAGQ